MRTESNRKARLTTLAVTGAAAAAAVSAGTAGSASADSGVWDRVAQCESGGNWNISTGNGFYGGLQFTQSTWRAYGGSGSPQNASKAEQIRVAKRVLAGQGAGAWPVCSKRAGLTSGNGGSASSIDRSSRSTEKRVETKRTVKAAPKHTAKTERKVVRHQAAAPKHSAPATPSVKASGNTVTVRSGDTLSKLAERLDVSSWRQLWAANSKTVSNPNLIFVGQVLHLPA
nr:transglycosylase family protein [Luteipulveratus mongoliensis]